MKTLGIVLIIVGIFMCLFPEINYTQKEKVANIGKVEITRKEDKTLSWPLYSGGVAIAAGIILLLAGGRKNNS